LILSTECVTCNDILNQGLEELNFIGEWREINLVITAVRNTHYTEGNTDLHKGDVIVEVVVTFMYDYNCSTMNSPTRIGVSGARSYRERCNRPVDSKILMFMLCIQIMECCIINCIGSLTMDILYMYIQGVINEAWNLL
jgi:hypothetical protein